jgi:hypothetical protein
MSRWNYALASLAVALVVGGCTIYTEGKDPKGPPPPPPTPPAKAPPPPAQTAAPAPTQTATGGLFRFGKRTNPGGATTPQQGEPNLVVTVADGSCDIAVGATRYGVTNKVEATLPAGDHQVTCQPASGALQSQIAQVKAGRVAAVVFSLTSPGNTGTQSLPVDKRPPIGRPTPN